MILSVGIFALTTIFYNFGEMPENLNRMPPPVTPMPLAHFSHPS